MDIGEVKALLQKVFPGGVPTPLDKVEDGIIRDFAQEIRGEVFLIGPHAIIVDEVHGVNWGATRLHWKPSGLLPFPLDTPSFDACEIKTEDDLIGWASFVHGEVMRLVISKFNVCLNPLNLLPMGRTSAKMLKTPLQIAAACGLTGGELADRILPELLPLSTSAWEFNPFTGRYLLTVNSTGKGQFAGRVSSAHHTHTPGTYHVEIRYRIPIDYSINPRPGAANLKILDGKMSAGFQTTFADGSGSNAAFLPINSPLVVDMTKKVMLKNYLLLSFDYVTRLLESLDTSSLALIKQMLNVVTSHTIAVPMTYPQGMREILKAAGGGKTEAEQKAEKKAEEEKKMDIILDSLLEDEYE